MISAQRDLDAKNRELKGQREELRKWGRELEGLVEEKTAALLRARDTLYRSEKLAALGRLSANVAHEINNPLAYVITNLDYLLGGAETLEAARERELLEAAREGAERVRHIVRDLRLFARPDEELIEPVDVNQVLETVSAPPGT